MVLPLFLIVSLALDGFYNMKTQHFIHTARFGQALDIAQFQKDQVGDKQMRKHLEKEEDIKDGHLVKEQYEAYQAAKGAFDLEFREISRSTQEI